MIRNTVEEAVLADSIGIDSFNIGEHYRPEFMDSAGHVILAAIASRTERIRLGTVVTVLSTQDPVRAYNNFATLDAVSGGRAQLVVTEGHLATWVGVGGSPQSVIRAARFGLPLMLAVIGGNPDQFAAYVELYKRALEQYGQPALPIGLHSLGFVASTDEEASDAQWPYWQEQFEWAASSADGGDRPTTSSGPRSLMALCMSARPRQSRIRSPPSLERSSSHGSTLPSRSDGYPTSSGWRPSSSTAAK